MDENKSIRSFVATVLKLLFPGFVILLIIGFHINNPTIFRIMILAAVISILIEPKKTVETSRVYKDYELEEVLKQLSCEERVAGGIGLYIDYPKDDYKSMPPMPSLPLEGIFNTWGYSYTEEYLDPDLYHRPSPLVPILAPCLKPEVKNEEIKGRG